MCVVNHPSCAQMIDYAVHTLLFLLPAAVEEHSLDTHCLVFCCPDVPVPEKEEKH